MLGAVPAAGAEDPLEPANRKIFAFNDTVDRWVLRPVASGYDRVTPQPVQRGIGNFFENLGTPVVALNQVLQGKPKRGLGDFTRFLVNSTIGIGGLFDIAGRNGLPRHSEDFGQTLAVWTGGQGPFLTIPFRGPATTTHAVGMVLQGFASPLRLISPQRDRMIILAVDLIDTRADLLSTDRMVSGDRYLFIRDAYLQNREYQINDGQVECDPFLDDC
ncbi:MAG: VacJ family lipoprotein [Gammaproteobacteria bacterium]|nr:VacJ family lipoprotein [Gammaproteobacteria bacterium]